MAKSNSGSDKRFLDAARRCDGASMERIVNEGRVNVNATDQLGCTAVHLCCKSADLRSLAMLLEHGARSDVFDNAGMAPFHHAADRDFIETMAVLVSYGANVNIENKKDHKTPLHYATATNKMRATKFLLFCGADPHITDADKIVPALGMTKEELLRHSKIIEGYRAGKITTCGKMLKQNETYMFTAIKLTVENSDKNSHTFSFFCRKLPLEFIDSGSTREEIISDKYEYLVNRAIEKITVSVKVYSKATAYDEVQLIDNTGESFKCLKCMEDQQGTFYTFNIALKSYEDNIYSFFVTLSTKSDSFTATGVAQTVQSSVDYKVHAHFPDQCLPRNTTIDMKVLPVINSLLTNVDKEFVNNVSNFCEVRLTSQNRRTFSITLPLPGQSTDEDSTIVAFHTNQETQTPTEWKEVDAEINTSKDVATVHDSSVKSGTCIVTEVPKKRKQGFLKWIAEFLGWLHNAVSNRMKPCCFFAMTKLCPDSSFRLLVGISDEMITQTVIKKWEEEKYVTQRAQTKSGYLLKPNSKILTKICLDDIKVRGCNELFMVYQTRKESIEEFLVIGKEHDTTNVYIFKTEKTKPQKQEVGTSQCLTQINVELLEGIKLDKDELSLRFTEFPDNKFLTWLAGEIGHEWMMVGVGIGLKYSYLETIQKNNDAKRANLTMLYTWRGDSNNMPDMGITSLLHSLTRIGRKDLVTEMNTFVLTRISSNPEERICKWVKQLTSGLDDIDASPATTCDDGICISCLIEDEPAVPPFSEKFLLLVVSIIGSNLQLLQQLNLSKTIVDEVRHSIQDPVAAMFKCLLLAQRNYSDIVQFFDDLFSALNLQQNRLAVMTIKRECRNWLRKSLISTDKRIRRLEKVLDVY